MCALPNLMLASLVLAFWGLSATRGRADDESDWAPAKKESLKKLETSMATPPINPSLSGDHLRDVQGNLQKFLSFDHPPSDKTTEALAASLVRGIGAGQISVPQSVGLSKELARLFTLPRIDYRDVNRLVARIDPIIQATGMRGTEKLRLYSQILNVARSAPTYNPGR